MRHDEARAEDTRDWLLKAKMDLRAGESGLNSGDDLLLPDVVFHAQQAAEKSFKAFLAWHDLPLRKTHNVREIGEACAGIDPSLADLARRGTPLTEYAWKFRYPGEPEQPAREEAEEALALAREVYDAILERLPEEVRP